MTILKDLNIDPVIMLMNGGLFLVLLFVLNSMFWQPISEAYPDALILHSVRDSAQTWMESVEATFMPYARMCLAPDWSGGRGLGQLLQRFSEHDSCFIQRTGPPIAKAQLSPRSCDTQSIS